MSENAGPGLRELDEAFQAWLDERAAKHAAYKREPADFPGKLAQLRSLQRELFDAGWVLYGWPVELGGKGGSVLHRGVVNDVLERNGFPPRRIFEHLDILPPALLHYGTPALIDRVFLPTLRGDVVWCQGFSEPTAGSDLAALRTRAERTDGGYRLHGHKIWTSWALWATHCFVLARTGAPDSRHRGLSAFVIETAAAGLTIGVIKQANGTDEFAEVFFDDAFVADEARVGADGEGWAVAMHCLAGERGSYTWLRQSELLPRLETLARSERAAESVGGLGDSLMDLIALRCRSREVMEILADGRLPGPESSVTKVLAIDAEQAFYDLARDVLSPGIDFGTLDENGLWQEQYLYSRAASVYGGSRQIQLNVIGKLMINEGENAGANVASDSDEVAALRASVRDALERNPDGRKALAGLDWWSFATAAPAPARGPGDAFGRATFAAWFEAQGRELVTSPALAGVRGAPWAAALDVGLDEIAVSVHAPGDRQHLVIGFDAKTRFVVAARGDEVVAFAADALRAEPSRAFDPHLVQSVRIEPGAERRLSVDAHHDARARNLARIAAACEILGASRRLLALAIRHSNEREQFGQPIARFQAVQHLISESQIEVSTLEALCRAALEEWCTGGASTLAAITKARAGRNGLNIAQRALQCFGAIGFTDEHPHHRYSKRIHTLDALFGSHAALRRELGRELVRSGSAERCVQIWHPDDG